MDTAPEGERPSQAGSTLDAKGEGSVFRTPLAGRWNEEAIVASYEGYCVKCREKRTFDGQEVELANGRRAAQGTCPVCGTKMNRILGKK